MAESEAEENIKARALGNGVLCLNSVFVVRHTPIRLTKRSSVRLTIPEIFWVAIVGLLSGALLYGIALFLGAIPFIRDAFEPKFIILGALVIAPLGRKVARFSPYRETSGEGLGAWMGAKFNKRDIFMGLFSGRKYATGYCITEVSGKTKRVKCVEWEGTSRARMAPRYDPSASNEHGTQDGTGNLFVSVELRPLATETGWVRKYNHLRRKRGMLDVSNKGHVSAIQESL